MNRTRREKVIVTFESSQDAILMERLSRDNNIPGRLIPVPRSISASCGLCWMAEKQEEKHVCQLLESQQLRYEGLYHIEMF